MVAGHLRGVDSRKDAIAATSETAQNRKRDHPLHQEMETTRVDGVRGDAEAAPRIMGELGEDDVPSARDALVPRLGTMRAGPDLWYR